MNDQIAADEAFARMLFEEEQKQYEQDRQSRKESPCHVLEETIPDLHELFVLFNRLYFDNQLDMVEVKWSKKMTRCAGTCTFKGGNHCIITMSEPLLKFRPKNDMINTLLHEMIHALLFITQKNTDRDGHGPMFIAEANRINTLANTNITIYHDFHDEVDYYLTHIWKCDGVCADKPPYFGIVKRSINRPPQPADTWYAEHQLTCGGTFKKISEPNDTKKQKKRTNTLFNYFESQQTKKHKQ
ncbi:SprT-like family-domain-containing protein [Gilbertella persicaria]|uniref:SprT-like family-domain-containing protein n=1 Tax=Gilbertella persicaria TaxID=101096 RepID=UPI002220BAE3|nr:SprT-like family-domain-containing protein [Gilbertella persicaria]KAI8076512.1 SprT-like family-domain-containing protein [Gilbertella persicaria]